MDKLTSSDKRLIDYALAFLAANIEDDTLDSLDAETESELVERIRDTKAKVQ